MKLLTKKKNSLKKKVLKFKSLKKLLNLKLKFLNNLKKKSLLEDKNKKRKLLKK